MLLQSCCAWKLADGHENSARAPASGPGPLAAPGPRPRNSRGLPRGPGAERFASLDKPRTQRAYCIDIREFTPVVGIAGAEEFRTGTRAHVIAWR